MGSQYTVTIPDYTMKLDQLPPLLCLLTLFLPSISSTPLSSLVNIKHKLFQHLLPKLDLQPKLPIITKNKQKKFQHRLEVSPSQSVDKPGDVIKTPLVWTESPDPVLPTTATPTKNIPNQESLSDSVDSEKHPVKEGFPTGDHTVWTPILPPDFPTIKPLGFDNLDFGNSLEDSGEDDDGSGDRLYREDVLKKPLHNKTIKS